MKNGQRVPLIQAFGQIKIPTGKPGETKIVQIRPSSLIYPVLMKNYLLQKQTCLSFLNACSDGSLNESLNASCK